MHGKRLQLPGLPSVENPVAGFVSDDGRVIGGASSAMRTTRQVAVVWACS
jgi:hypothetical protein